MLFPELRNERFGYLDLNKEAKRWRLASGSYAVRPNPLLDPDVCLQFVQSAHQRLGMTYSYGGWMEYRADLWNGSYLDTRGTHIHLGVDFNVPVDTAVAANESLQILRVDNDTPEEHGWGGRVIAKRAVAGDILIYAHLGDVYCRPGDVVSSGEIFARVGLPSNNGGWYPHLHVQCVAYHHFVKLLPDLSDLDGYGVEDKLAHVFPDPMNVLKLHD